METAKKDQLKKDYDKLLPKYERLAINLKQSLELLLKEEEIPFLVVNYRVKDFTSFIDKVDKKEYDDPFIDNEDFCGLRVIAYFNNDIDRIIEVIEKEFIVLTLENKQEINPKAFYYRSHHAIISVKAEWAKSPNFRGLEELKAEIQIRTVLAHAWAEVEHQLVFKNEVDNREQYQTIFAEISSSLKRVDKQFQDMKDTLIIFKKSNIKKDIQEKQKKLENFLLEKWNEQMEYESRREQFANEWQDMGMQVGVLRSEGKLPEAKQLEEEEAKFEQEFWQYEKEKKSQIEQLEQAIETIREEIFSSGQEVFGE